MESENTLSLRAQLVNAADADEAPRRRCGCKLTSEKLKDVLKKFPVTPHKPPTVTPTLANTCISAYCTSPCEGLPNCVYAKGHRAIFEGVKHVKVQTMFSRSWQLVADAVQVLQLSATATALALYYLIYCYMQLVYYTLRSAVYFHQADGPMKVTIGVVTLTSLLVGFNMLIRVEKIVGLL